MEIYKLIIVEDDSTLIEQYKESIELYNDDKDLKFDVKYLSTMEEALNIIDTIKFDGAVIDLKLDSDDVDKAEGNNIIRTIKKNFRIPVIILTGFKGDLEEDIKENLFTKVVVKGECSIDEVLNHFIELKDNRLIQLLGENGMINQYLLEIFWNKIVDEYDYWNKEYEGEKFARVVSRHIINYLFEMLEMNNDGEFDEYDSSEVYIIPPIKEHLFTGDIIKKDEEYYIVLMPACDLANEGKVKQVVLGKIISYDKTVFTYRTELEGMNKKINSYTKKIIELEDKIAKCIEENNFLNSNKYLIEKNKYLELKFKKQNDKNITLEKIKKICTNNYKLSWHFLPCTNRFCGGIIDFTDIQSINMTDIKDGSVYSRECSISSGFIKDITARFSQYYARQGQPNFNIESILKSLSIN